MSDAVAWAWRQADVRELAADSLVVFVAAGDEADPILEMVLDALGASLADLGGDGARPSHADSWRVPALGRLPVREVVLVGVERASEQLLALHEAAMAAGLITREREHVAVAVPDSLGASPQLEALVEGLACGRYRHAGSKSTDPVSPARVERISLVSARPGPDDLEATTAFAETVAKGLAWVRDLVNAPGADLTPRSFAELAERAAVDGGIDWRLWSEDELAAGRFGGIVGVGSGSVEPALLAELTYRGGAAGEAPTVLVGKGVTFDTGGLDMKPYRAMLSMKNDMAGAAAVLGAIVAAAELRLPINLVALLPLVENMPGGAPLRPSDVVTHRNGMTTEVVSPDAEGRLILADALAYAAERSPRAIVSVATLTGGTGVGADLWGVMATAPSLSDALLRAGERAGEPGWELPVWRRYRAYLHSHVADQLNVGPEYPFPLAAVIGAVYLDRFVPEALPWAHLDIGATAWRTGFVATSPWLPGATGSPLRMLVRWLVDGATTEGVG